MAWARIFTPAIISIAKYPGDNVPGIDLRAMDLGAVDLGAVDLGAVDLGAGDLRAVLARKAKAPETFRFPGPSAFAIKSVNTESI